MAVFISWKLEGVGGWGGFLCVGEGTEVLCVTLI